MNLKILLDNNFTVFFIPVRWHMKFNATMGKRQSRLLGKFDQEIEDTIDKIKNNKRIKIKRKKASLMETTKILLDKCSSQSAMNNNYPEGSPEQLVIRREGMTSTFLSTRMKILNNNFLRSITEIFVTDEEFSQMMTKYKFRITEV